jgi:hypothetical protein
VKSLSPARHARCGGRLASAYDFDTTTATFAPGDSRLPGFGFWESKIPGWPEDTFLVTVPSLQLASASACLAALRVLPMSFGTMQSNETLTEIGYLDRFSLVNCAVVPGGTSIDA